MKKSAIILFYLFTFLPFHAQDSLLLRNYHYVKHQDAWLTQPNAAALTRYQQKNIALAEVTSSYGGGSLTEFGGADNVLQVTANVESFYRISPRAVVFGSMSYDNWTGRNMTGSAFLSPLTSHLSPLVSRRPFDIVEDSLTNAGRKHRDTYQLSGGFGYSVSDAFAVGIKADYTAANYAKYKDLRHKNKLMDLQFTAGVLLSLPSSLTSRPSPLTIGANYSYHRQTESITFNTYGKNDKTYKSFIDYGAMMGVVEQFGSDGLTEKSREMPYFEDGHGASFQLGLSPLSSHLLPLTSHLSLLTSLSFHHATGYYGRKSPYTISYTNHDRDVFTVGTAIQFSTATTSHRLDFGYRNEKLKNRAETFRTLINANGSPNYEYYDAVETGDKQWYNLSFDYTLHLGVRGEQPAWTLQAGYHWQQRNISADLYPYYRRQVLKTREWTALVERNIIAHRGVYTITLNGGFLHGSGEPFVDGTFVTPSSKQPQPATMEAFLYQDYHLLTAPQYSIGLQLKYAFRFPGTSLLTHVRGAFQHRKANTQENQWCGQDHTTGTIAVGCTF